MSKRFRQYAGLLCAVAAYYVLHEGAHLIAALCMGAFKGINFMGLGVQIDVYAERMTDAQLGIFCLVGVIASQCTAYALVFAANAIGKSRSKVLKACMYYVTIAMLLIDPLYLSVLCGFFGGGDMNGIKLLIAEPLARLIFGAVLAVNAVVFFKCVLPVYKRAFEENKDPEQR